MKKQTLLIIGVIAALVLPGLAAAQDSLIVWNVLSPEDSRTFAAAGDNVSLETMDAALLLDNALSADAGEAPAPDVIIASQITASTLFDYDMLAATGSRSFFLDGLLSSLPDLLAARCQDEALERCLWPGASAALPVQFPDDALIERTHGWLCQSEPGIPSCYDNPWAGVPVSWGFTILLFNYDWLAANGADAPYDLETALETRSQWKMRLVEAERDFLPLAGDLRADEIYVVSSAVLVEEPDGVMTSLASFFQAGYMPVLSLNIDSAYVGAFAANPDAAQIYVQSLDNPATKTTLFFSSQRLPAFYANEVHNAGVDSAEGEATLRALVLLTTYAALMY